MRRGIKSWVLQNRPGLVNGGDAIPIAIEHEPDRRRASSRGGAHRCN
jgi:hypothetical protein